MFTVFCTYGFRAAMTWVFGLVLPVIFYTFLSGAWFLKVATDAMNQHRH